MFTDIQKPRKRGRPAGQTVQGDISRDRLYATAKRMIASRGYEATTLRDIAKAADVSVGLLYRYFPSKQAIIIALYDELSADYARRTATIPSGKWRDRFLFALETSLEVLQPHRVPLRALIPVLVGDPEEGVFGPGSAFSRQRVQGVFEQAVLLWWLLDKTPGQRATAALVALTRQLLPSAFLALRLPPVRRFVTSIDELIREGLFGEAEVTVR